MKIDASVKQCFKIWLFALITVDFLNFMELIKNLVTLYRHCAV